MLKSKGKLVTDFWGGEVPFLFLWSLDLGPQAADHNPGSEARNPTLAAARLQCWELILSAYTSDIEFHPIGAIRDVDGLSRLPLSAAVFNVCLPVTSTQLRAVTRTDPAVSKVLRYTRGGRYVLGAS